jgi:hypothetical protein
MTLVLASCTPIKSFRWKSGATDTLCEPSATGSVSPACAQYSHEHAQNYDLYFVEYDDQGWPYVSSVANNNQTNDVVASLNSQSSANITLITFIHGWQHNADTDDDNVKTFRLVLHDVAELELTGRCHRKVMGLYVSWRGQSLNLPYIDVFSFWSRKNAALKVAQGSARELFARLKTAEATANQAWNQAAQATSNTALTDPCLKHLRSIVIGHSFGGLIVQSALSEGLIGDVATLQQQQAGSSGTAPVPVSIERDGDLVVLVNPAIEATRFDALDRITRSGSPYKTYRMPLFVSITSLNDYATRLAFPLGRSVDALFEHYQPAVKARERKANLETLGQDDDYWTHRLQLSKSTCKGWDDRPANGQSALHIQLKAERAQFTQFKKSLGSPPSATRESFPRMFCGDDTMELDLLPAADPNSPVWNIITEKPIVNSHGDITNKHLIEFVRQLYIESGDIAMD